MKKRLTALALSTALVAGFFGVTPAQADAGDCTIADATATCFGPDQESLRDNAQVTVLNLNNAPIQGDVLSTMSNLTELQYSGDMNVSLQESLKAPALTKLKAEFHTKETEVRSGSTFTLPTFTFLDGKPFEHTFIDGDSESMVDNPPAKKVGSNTFVANRPIRVTVFNRNLWGNFNTGDRTILWELDLGDMWMLNSYDYLTWGSTGKLALNYESLEGPVNFSPSQKTVPAYTTLAATGQTKYPNERGDTVCTWLRNGVVVLRENMDWTGACRYILQTADSGKKITVQVAHASRAGMMESLIGKTDSLSATYTVQEAVKFKVSSLRTPTVGKKLVPKISGAPSGASFSYQWHRNGVKIKGATKSSYTPVGADLNQRLYVKVTGSKSGRYEQYVLSHSEKVVKGKFAVTRAPSISGKTVYGQTLKANPGKRSSKPSKFAYQWLRDGKNVKGATKSSYKLGSKDIGKKIAVKVTASGAGFYTQTSRASKNQLVSKAKFTVKKKPAISGKHKVGKKLTAKKGTWSPKPDGYKYQWYRSGAPISKATKSTYKLTKRDKGKTIYVKVTASKKGYSNKTATSSVK